MNEEGNELPSTGTRAAWGALAQGLSDPEGRVYKIQSIPQLRKGITHECHSAGILPVTRGSYLMCLSFWGPSIHVCESRGSSGCLSESLPVLTLPDSWTLKPFWASDPEDLPLSEVTTVKADGSLKGVARGPQQVHSRYFHPRLQQSVPGPCMAQEDRAP